MYVVPRPEVNDDPLHAVRLASMAVATFALIPFVQPAIPPLLSIPRRRLAVLLPSSSWFG